jgi:subtilisin family serine protease
MSVQRCAAFALALLFTALPAFGAPAPAPPDPALPMPAPEAMPPSRLGSDQPISVLVRLAGEPAHRRYSQAGGRAAGGAARTAAQTQVATLRAQQDAFAQRAARLGARAGSRVQFLDNMVELRIPPSRLAQLRRIPGVLAIQPNREYVRADTTSTPVVRATEAWEGSLVFGSKTGRGVTIALIDTGVDYTHRHFGGEGNYEDNDRTVLGDVAWPPLALPQNPGDQLVIGGWDFVGDDYSFGLEPQPDPDPAGCPFSHGTHVAGTAAGYGVTAAGQTFTGDITQGNALFPAFPAASVNAFRIGPGTAPHANLVSLSVFGCAGSTGTDILITAMEFAATETFLGKAVDVVNMSLGSSYGGASDDDFLHVAQRALNEVGIVVVASAGNSGDTQLVTGAPGSAPGTISVANVTDSSAVISGELRYLDPDGVTQRQFPAVRGAMYPLDAPDPFTAEVVQASPAPGGVALACNPLTVDEPNQYSGRWVLVDRGTCVFSQKVERVKQAGGAGVIVVQNSGAAPITMGQEPGYDDSLPAVMISLSDGNLLKSNLGLGTVEATFDGAVQFSVATTAFVPSASTSRGGVVRGAGDRILKPDIAAPGDTITSAGAGTNDRGYTIGGTSMAAPHVAGLAALLIETYGRPSDADGVARIKQRLMNTATRDLRANIGSELPNQSPQRVGTGVADVVSAIRTPLLAYASDSPEGVSLSFGYPKQLTGQPLVVEKTVTLENHGMLPLQVDTGYAARSAWPGASIQVSPASLSMLGGSSALVTVTLTVDADQPNLNVPGDPLFSGASKSFLHEVSGYLTLTPTAPGVDPIRLSVYAAPHLTADTQAAASAQLRGRNGSVALEFSGTGFNLGPDANDHRSQVSAYTLLATSDPVESVDWDVDGDGTGFDPQPLTDYAYADLAYLGGVLNVVDASNSVLNVGLAMHGEWTSPRDFSFEIYVDVNDDGEFDYVWFPEILGGSADRFLVAYCPLDGGNCFLYGFLNYRDGSALNTMLFKNNVLNVPVGVRDASFALNYEGGPINLRVDTYQRDSDGAVRIDSVEATYEPGLSFGAGPEGNRYEVAEPGSASVAHALSAGKPPAILTLHHHQIDPQRRAQVTVLEGLELLSPASGSSVFQNSTPIEMRWTEFAGASEYRFTLDHAVFRPGSEKGALPTPLVDVVGTPADDGDPITCASGECVFELDLSGFEAGDYAWQVQATDAGGAVESLNGPFLLTLEPSLGDAIFSNGFE